MGAMPSNIARTSVLESVPLSTVKLLPARFALGRFEEDSELAEVLLAQPRERRHGRTGRDRAWVLQVVDLPLDAPVPRPLLRQLRSDMGADAVVRVAVRAARGCEEDSALSRVRRQVELLHPLVNLRECAGAGLFCRRALVGEDAHGD